MAINATMLVISQDQLLLNAMRSMVSPDGFNIIQRSIVDDAAALIAEFSPSIVLLDTSLTTVNAHHLCREIRTYYAGIVIVLVADYDELDELTAFENGADDYIRKRVHIKILLARISRLLKLSLPRSAEKERPITVGGLVVDPTRREVFVKDRRVQLTSIQFDLLWHLVNNRGRVVTRDDLNRLLYNKAYNGIDRSIDVYISRIRQKLGDDPAQPVYLKTVRGVGYLFADLR